MSSFHMNGKTIKMKLKPIIIFSVLITVVALSAMLLGSTTIYADDSVVDEINITVPVSCSLSGTGMDSHTTEINNGQSNSSIGETTIKAFCNDANGFAIYAIGYTDNTDGKNVLTNSTLGDTYDIVTGTATGPVGNVDSSQWAMKLSTITDPAPTYPIIIAGSSADTDKEQGDPDYSTFQEIPDNYAKVAYRTSSTDIGTSAEGSTLKSTYQAYISKTQAAGTYTGQVKYTMVHPHDRAAPEKPITCNSSGTTIGTNSNTDIVCMQDISSTNKSTILASMTEDVQYQLYDSRDFKQYYIAKFKDGNIWMTQNLDHDIRTDFAYTPSNTDIAANWIPDKSTYTTETNNWDYSDASPWIQQSYDPGELYWNGAPPSDPSSCNEVGGSWSYDLDECFSISNIPSEGDHHNHIGNYYSWTAALAMNDSSSISGDGVIVHQSICPAGWTLPTTTSSYTESPENGSFQYLLQQYGWSENDGELDGQYKVYDAPLYYTYSGNYYTTLFNVGSVAYYWSSAAYAYNNVAIAMSIEHINSLYISSFLHRGAGLPVRCLVAN